MSGSVEIASLRILRTIVESSTTATIQDSLYNSAGTSAVRDRTAISGHIGSEISLTGKSHGRNRHLFAGECLIQAKAGYGYSYPYVMFAGKF